jgi:Uma2 family endonuclease
MLDAKTLQTLPSTEELPCSDDTPVDNEDQNYLPNFLLFLLEFLWARRQDWFFGIDMAVYHTTGDNPKIPVVPDGFLSVGVERRKQGKSRSSYATWEENNVVPILALEIVSQTVGHEYDEKLTIYANLGVLYYIIYNPEYWRRDKHQPFEVYRLVEGQYCLQSGEPIWMPELELGIGRVLRQPEGEQRELLYWFDENGDRYATPDELRQQAEQRAKQAERLAQQEKQRAEELARRLQEMGIDL